MCLGASQKTVLPNVLAAMTPLVSVDFSYASNYGVPQARPRTIIFAAAPGTRLPKPPKPSHQISSKKGVETEDKAWIVTGLTKSWQQRCRPNQPAALRRWHAPRLQAGGGSAVLLRDVLGGLPAFEGRAHPNGDKSSITHWADQDVGTFDKATARGEGGVLNHRSRDLSEDDHARVCQIAKISAANPNRDAGHCSGPGPWADWRDLEATMRGVAAGKVSAADAKVPSGKWLVLPFMRGEKGGKNISFRRLDPQEAMGTLM